jgi:hypothetical protein
MFVGDRASFATCWCPANCKLSTLGVDFRQIADSLESANPQALELLSDRAYRPLK